MRRSNPAFCRAAPKLDCFRLRSLSYGGHVAEPVIGRRFARTRWLAMTISSALGCLKIESEIYTKQVIGKYRFPLLEWREK